MPASLQNGCLAKITRGSLARVIARVMSGSAITRLGPRPASTAGSGALPWSAGPPTFPTMSARTGMPSLLMSRVTVSMSWAGSGEPPFAVDSSATSVPNLAMTSGTPTSWLRWTTRACARSGSGCPCLAAMGPTYSRKSEITIGRWSCLLTFARRLKVSTMSEEPLLCSDVRVKCLMISASASGAPDCSARERSWTFFWGRATPSSRAHCSPAARRRSPRRAEHATAPRDIVGRGGAGAALGG
mmetsp:Transcript_33295/g.99155  ORF Transcript_33295/g.99155 Transcript_33295/m.99155 type:complete len:243 (+) Transcript_33295:97-825(+)